MKAARPEYISIIEIDGNLLALNGLFEISRNYR